jgi:hypothetical protein
VDRVRPASVFALACARRCGKQAGGSPSLCLDALPPYPHPHPHPAPQGRVKEFAEKPKGDALKAMAVDTRVRRGGRGGGVGRAVTGRQAERSWRVGRRGVAGAAGAAGGAAGRRNPALAPPTQTPKQILGLSEAEAKKRPYIASMGEGPGQGQARAFQESWGLRRARGPPVRKPSLKDAPPTARCPEHPTPSGAPTPPPPQASTCSRRRPSSTCWTRRRRRAQSSWTLGGRSFPTPRSTGSACRCVCVCGVGRGGGEV